MMTSKLPASVGSGVRDTRASCRDRDRHVRLACMSIAISMLVSMLALPAIAAAQHDQHGAAGEKLGTVHFETSCSPSTRADFDRAVALLHSFEFRSAMETFNKVLAADASCAVAYWGIGLCHWGNPFAGVKAGPPPRARPRSGSEGPGHRRADATGEGVRRGRERALQERRDGAAS